MKTSKKIISLMLVLTAVFICSCSSSSTSENKYNIESEETSAANKTEIQAKDTTIYITKELPGIKFDVPENWLESQDENRYYYYATPYSFLMVTCTETTEPLNDNNAEIIFDSMLSNENVTSENIQVNKHEINGNTFYQGDLIMNLLNEDFNVSSYVFYGNNKIYTLGFTSTNINIYSQQIQHILNSINIIKETSSINSSDEAETETTHTTPQIWSTGQYKCGVDIAPGIYAVISESGYFCISSDPNGDDIIHNDNFDNNSIFEIHEGQYVEISRAYAVKLEDADLGVENGILKSGKYIVGKHIPAGEYKLKATSDYGGYYCLSTDANDNNIISNDNFDGERYVSIQDNQYLTLSRCELIAK